MKYLSLTSNTCVYSPVYQTRKIKDNILLIINNILIPPSVLHNNYYWSVVNYSLVITINVSKEQTYIKLTNSLSWQYFFDEMTLSNRQEICFLQFYHNVNVTTFYFQFIIFVYSLYVLEYIIHFFTDNFSINRSSCKIIHNIVLNVETTLVIQYFSVSMRFLL